MNKILVVDDDPDILGLVETILSMHDFDVECTLRWEEIDSRIVSQQPDLVLLDISLSGADGRDICKKIKQSKDTGHLPVILFSANVSMGEEINSCLAQDFIAKPFDIGHFVKTIKSHML